MHSQNVLLLHLALKPTNYNNYNKVNKHEMLIHFFPVRPQRKCAPGRSNESKVEVVI